MHILTLLLTSLLYGTAMGTLINLKPYQGILHLVKLNRPPLNCAMCLPFWVTIVMGLTIHLWRIDEVFFTALVASFIGDQTDKIIKTLV